MKTISLIITLFLPMSAFSADRAYYKDRCTTHYANFFMEVYLEINMGHTPEDIKKEISGDSKQKPYVESIIDDLFNGNDEHAKQQLDKLIELCTEHNYNKYGAPKQKI